MSDPLPDIESKYPTADFDTEPRSLSLVSKIIILLLIVMLVLLLVYPVIFSALNHWNFPLPTPTPIPSLWEIA